MTKRSSGVVAVAGCLLVSAGLNVALAMRTAAQRAEIERGTGDRELMLGRTMTTLEGVDAAGNHVRVEFGTGDRPVVIYVFEPGCDWCDRNYEAVLALYGRLSARARFVGLSLSHEGLDGYLAERPLPFDVLTSVDKQVVTGYALAGTPRTLVVGADGRIEGNILGAWRGILEHRIEAACGQSAVREGESS